jgi:hypothetical protein
LTRLDGPDTPLDEEVIFVESTSIISKILVEDPCRADMIVGEWLVAYACIRVMTHEHVMTDRGGIEIHVSYVTDVTADDSPTKYCSFIIRPGTDAAERANEWLATNPWILIQSCGSMRMRDGTTYFDFFYHKVIR